MLFHGVLALAALWCVASFGQESLFKHGFETPIIVLKTATFNTLFAFDGSLINGNYVANPANVQTTADQFNMLQLDLAGLQEVHDYGALETLASETGMQLAAGRTEVGHQFPTAVLSRLPIFSEASYSGHRMLNEAGVLMPDGTIAYVFSIHVSGERWGRVNSISNSEVMRRRTGHHPVIIFGDMNGYTSRLIELSRGALHVVYDVGIDAILATSHFQLEGEGQNFGSLGFSDHPLLVADVRYTPGSVAQIATPSLEHAMPPDSSWNVGAELVPEPTGIDSITITHLPEKGTLKLNGMNVALDQTIAIADVPGLHYDTDAADIGKDYWIFDLDESVPPAVQAPRWVDVFIQTRLSNIRFGYYTESHPDTTEGVGFADLAYANVGETIYANDEAPFTNFDVFNENLPPELQGSLFIRNGGRAENSWSREYMYFDLDEPSQVYIALPHRQDGTDRSLPDWALQWADVSFNAKTGAPPYDIFTRCLDEGEVQFWGNHTFGNNDENLVVFLGGACVDPEPGCDLIGIDNFTGLWATEARDCGREDCSTDGRWYSWDGRIWCRALIVEETNNWTIANEPTRALLHFWTDWGAWDLDDCGDGVTTVRVPACGLEFEVTRDGHEQQHTCNTIDAGDTITIEKDHDPCEYVIIGNPYFD